MSSMKIQQITTKQRYYSLIYFISFSILLKIVIIHSINLRSLNSCDSLIHLIVEGNGTQSLLSNDFNIEPDEILINGVKDISCKKVCNMAEVINNVTLIFINQIDSLENMFKGLNNIIEADLSNFDTSYVTTMSSMFKDCFNLLSVYLSNYNTYNLVNISHIFENCLNLQSIDFGNINTTSVENMEYLFTNCTKIESIDLSKFDTSKVTTVSYMFYRCLKLQSINLDNIDTSSVESMDYLFYGCVQFNTIDLSHLQTSKVKNMSYMFRLCSNLKSINFGDINTSSVENMNCLFANCYKLESVDISKFDTSKLTTMYAMFYRCELIESINFGNINTSSVENMHFLFYQCSNLISINLSHFDTSKVTTMRFMFQNCNSLKYIDISNFDASKVVDMFGMFKNCSSLKSIDFGYMNTSSLTIMERTFEECSSLKSIDLSKFDTSKVTTMLGIFHSCINLENINFGNINTSSVENMRSMFNKCYKLQKIDLSKFDTSNVTTFYWMFAGCHNLISIDISHFDTSKVETMYAMFRNCKKIKSINFGNINTSSVTNMEYLFSECTNITYIDISKFDTSKVTSMFAMFHECTDLETINLGKLNTSLVENMRSFFHKCYKLNVVDLSTFDTSKVTTFQWMFTACRSLKYLNLSNFKATNLSNMYSMFNGCSSLIYLNLFSFKINTTINKTYAFNNLPSNIKYCIEDNYTQFYLLGNDSISSCSDSCFDKNNTKIDLFNNTCIDSCLNNGFDYEYKTMCFNECPNNTFIREGNESFNNAIECFKQEPEGYYFDSNDNLFKKCYETCKYCYGNGSYYNNNCKECKDNYAFYTNLNNITNCYQICTNYYYFDELNNYNCTENLECQEKYSKLIINKKQCIDECNKDDVYKYEYNNECHKECPKNTVIGDNYTCNEKYSITDKIPENYEVNSMIYKYSENPDYSEVNSKTDDSSKNSDINTIIYKYLEYPLYSDKITMSYNLINNENVTQRLIKTSSSSQVLYECKISDTLNNNCNFFNITNNTEIFNIIEDNIKSLYNPETGKSQIIEGENGLVFQLTNAKNEKELLNGKYLSNQNMSIIDLGQCEVKLKKEYHINESDSLIYLKQENINGKASEKNIRYEIYEPYTFTKLNLSICSEETINIYVKIDLSEETRKTYENMKSLGYDMFNINDPFYQDICTPYKSENNTDILLSDRIDFIYNNKDSQCQPNCQFSSYISNSQYANCTCSVIEDKENNEKKFSGKKLYESFYDILKYSNYKIFKCYNLIFNQNIFNKNFGNYIILSISSFYFVCFIFFIIKGIAPLKNILRNLSIKTEQEKNKAVNKTFNNIKLDINNNINDKNNYINNNTSNNKKNNNINSNQKNYNENKNNNNKINNLNKSNINNKSNYKNNKDNKSNYNNKYYNVSYNKKIRRHKIINFSHPIKRTNYKNIQISKNNVDTKRKELIQGKNCNKKNFKESYKPNIIINSVRNNISFSSKIPLEFPEKNNNNNRLENLNLENDEGNKIPLNAFELNELEYEEAIINDHRTFFQTYIDILSREHIIIFTFLICNDYNISYIKYIRFIFLLATDMALNVFFFSDESMHKIFLNYGKYNFIQQIPQIVYTTIISQLIEVFLCFLSMTDKHIYNIKQLSHPWNKNIVLKILRCIKIKLVFFFIFTFIFFLFYWYTITAFCAVYENTQITYLKDSLLSFLLGIAYPFILYLFPTSLRILSLR